MSAKAMVRSTIKGMHTLVNMTVMVIVLALLVFSAYALWDSSQLFREAVKSNYTVFKPAKEDNGKSFRELQTINAEVIAWLSVYGTNIDYPVTQGEDNMKYVTMNAEGQYSLTGAIFLDSDNCKRFSDFNSILYGHHMEKKAMFGEIGSFADQEVFETHPYGNLHFDEKDHGIEFFAFVQTDAYDYLMFSANVSQEKRTDYLNNILAEALFIREDVTVNTDDQLILLNTCSSASTNGRDVLVGRLVDDVFDNSFKSRVENDIVDSGLFTQNSLAQWLILILIVIILVFLLVLLCKRNKKRRANQGQFSATVPCNNRD